MLAYTHAILNPRVACFTRTVITFSWFIKIYLSSRYHGSCLLTEVTLPESSCYSAFCQSKLEVNRQCFVFSLRWKVWFCFLVILRLLHIPSSQGCPGFFCEMQEVMEQQTINPQCCDVTSGSTQRTRHDWGTVKPRCWKKWKHLNTPQRWTSHTFQGSSCHPGLSTFPDQFLPSLPSFLSFSQSNVQPLHNTRMC